jgi:formylmethanofuran dehydrogenase subunit E
LAVEKEELEGLRSLEWSHPCGVKKKMTNCEFCGEETAEPVELYGRKVCLDCYEYYKALEGRSPRCCCGYFD